MKLNSNALENLKKKYIKKYKNSTVNANQIYNFKVQCNMNENETSYSPNL